MEYLKFLNIGISFLLEITMLLAIGYWGFSFGKNVWAHYLLGIGVPLLVALLWGILLAPKSSFRLNITGGFYLSTLFYSLTALALFRSGQPVWAMLLAVIALFNRILIVIWQQW